MHSGMCDVAIAGGVDFMSDVPIRFNRSMRSKMLAMGKVGYNFTDCRKMRNLSFLKKSLSTLQQ